MPTKIFLTGVTGYIGGDAFYALKQAYPDFEYAVLVRSEAKAEPVRAAYPDARIVIGDNNSAELIEAEAANADIVIHTSWSADDVPSAKAIAAGLARGHTAASPGFWLHVCGTGILTWNDYLQKRWGQPPAPDQAYDDVADIDRIRAIPDSAMHRDVDVVVQAASPDAAGAVRAAIVCPPTIYGKGRGPVNTRSMQLYGLARTTLETGGSKTDPAKGNVGLYPVVETGRNEWDYVHVADLSAWFVLAVGAALDPARNADPDLFGPRGYFFLESGSYAWGDAARKVAEEVKRQGWVKEIKEKHITAEEINEGKEGKGPAHNSKSKAVRAAKFLGWKPKERSMWDEIPLAVKQEAESLGLQKVV